MKYQNVRGMKSGGGEGKERLEEREDEEVAV